MRRLPWLAVVCLVAGGCLFGGDDDGAEGPPHTCDGATLEMRFEGDVDPTGFVADVEAAITGVAIDCTQHESAGVVIVTCGPAGQGCGFTTLSEAEAHEPAFRDAIARFDPALADYPYSVIDDCACRVY